MAKRAKGVQRRWPRALLESSPRTLAANAVHLATLLQGTPYPPS
ncbi:hypothetical protein AB0D78_13365 [Streptomyces avermitilis]